MSAEDIKPSRRGLLAAAGASLAVGLAAVPPAQSADRELIEKIGEFLSLFREELARFPGGAAPILDDEERRIFLIDNQKKQRLLLEEIVAARATTPEGFVARAKMAWAWCHQPDPNDQYSWDDAMLFALVRDMAT